MVKKISEINKHVIKAIVLEKEYKRIEKELMKRKLTNSKGIVLNQKVLEEYFETIDTLKALVHEEACEYGKQD